jgi:hypothetical protein
MKATAAMSVPVSAVPPMTALLTQPFKADPLGDGGPSVGTSAPAGERPPGAGAGGERIPEGLGEVAEDGEGDGVGVVETGAGDGAGVTGAGAGDGVTGAGAGAGVGVAVGEAVGVGVGGCAKHEVVKRAKSKKSLKAIW